MRLRYKSWFYKFRSVLRYYWISAYYGSRVRIGARSMIGKNCGIHVFPKGRLTAAGRIIVADEVMLYTKGILELGTNFGINNYSRIVSHEKISIGNNVTIGQMVAILDHDHDYSMSQGHLTLDGYNSAPVRIGSNVWIGDKCTILKGVTIGDNVVLAAHTLVHKNVPSGVVIGGSPFKILKQL